MSSELKYWYLHDHRLFKNLSFNEIDSLCILKKFKKSSKNELLDLPFSDKERIYFLKKGTIKLVKINKLGEEILLDILQKGDLFGDLNLEKPVENEEYFKVVSDEAVICTFYREKLEEIMYKKPEFALSYIKFMGFSIKKLQNSYKNIFFKDAKTRLVLMFDMIIEKENERNPSFTLPSYLTQKDMAQLICTTRQTIITLLKELENDRLIEHTERGTIIVDVSMIKNFVQNVK
jgi:CRP/FNR family transcriptional regulator